MCHELLSQNEIENLLAAVSSSPGEKTAAVTDARKIRIYDFNRPDKFTRKTGRWLSDAVNLALKKINFELEKQEKQINLHCLTIDQLREEEFYRSIPDPSLVVFGNWGKKHHYTVAFEPEPLLQLCSIEIPGYQKAAEGESLSLNENTQKVAAHYAKLLLEGLRTEFQAQNRTKKEIAPFAEPDFLLKPRMLPYPPAQMVVLLVIEMKTGDSSTMLSVVFDADTINDLWRKAMGTEEKEIPETMDTLKLANVPMNVDVRLGRASRSLSEVLNFAEGTIIQLDKLAGEPVDILVNGKNVAQGEVILVDENMGVRITQVL